MVEVPVAAALEVIDVEVELVLNVELVVEVELLLVVTVEVVELVVPVE